MVCAPRVPEGAAGRGADGRGPDEREERGIVVALCNQWHRRTRNFIGRA